MENRYPLFAGGRILKKESLWDLRDYTYSGWQLQYEGYTDGIINGCGIHVEGMNLIVGRGMLKCQDFIYLIGEKVIIPFTAENQTTALKASFDVKHNHSDFITYEVNFFLDHELERQPNQIELCRFHLREGSSLRDHYENFRDIRTEYDTLNLVDATIAGKSLTGIHPMIINKYIEQLPELKEPADFGFAYIAMQTEGWVNRKTLALYLANKIPNITWQEVCGWDNNLIVDKLEAFLDYKYENGKYNPHKNVIFVD